MTTILDFLAGAAQPLLWWQWAAGAACAALAVLAAVGGWRWLRRAARPLGAVPWRRRVLLAAAALVLLLSAEGWWELLTGPVGLPVWAALPWAVVVELSIVGMAAQAQHAMAQARRTYATALVAVIYATALVAGSAAASAAPDGSAAAVRLFMPVLGVVLWHIQASYEHPRGGDQPLTWLWSPRRLLVALGAMSPHGAGLEAVAEARRLRAQARAEARRERVGLRLAGLTLLDGAGTARAQARRRAQLDRLLRTAGADAVSLALAQVDRARTARRQLLGAPPAAAQAAPQVAAQAAPQVAAQPAARRQPAQGAAQAHAMTPTAVREPARSRTTGATLPLPENLPAEWESMSTRDQAGWIHDRRPGTSKADIGRMLGVTRQTIADHLANLAKSAEDAPATVNGHSPVGAG